MNSTRDCCKFVRDGKVQGIGFWKSKLFALKIKVIIPIPLEVTMEDNLFAS